MNLIWVKYVTKILIALCKLYLLLVSIRATFKPFYFGFVCVCVCMYVCIYMQEGSYMNTHGHSSGPKVTAA